MLLHDSAAAEIESGVNSSTGHRQTLFCCALNIYMYIYILLNIYIEPRWLGSVRKASWSVWSTCAQNHRIKPMISVEKTRGCVVRTSGLPLFYNGQAGYSFGVSLPPIVKTMHLRVVPLPSHKILHSVWRTKMRSEGGTETSPPWSSSPHSVCGITHPDSRIMGGANASAGAWPWHAALLLNILGTYYLQCSGSLINDQWILTAASCVHRWASVLVTWLTVREGSRITLDQCWVVQ